MEDEFKKHNLPKILNLLSPKNDMLTVNVVVVCSKTILNMLN